MSREPIPTYFFSLCVVRLGPRFLLVQLSPQSEGVLHLMPSRAADRFTDGSGVLLAPITNELSFRREMK